MVVFRSASQPLSLPWLQTSLWQSLYPSQVVGEPALIKEIDCLTVTLDDVKEVAANFRLPLYEGESRVSGFAGWFDVQFQASYFCRPSTCKLVFVRLPHAWLTGRLPMASHQMKGLLANICKFVGAPFHQRPLTLLSEGLCVLILDLSFNPGLT